MATVKAVLNKDRMKKCGGYSLVIQIIHKRVRRVIYTGYVIRPVEFNSETQKVFYTELGQYKHKQIKEINEYIEKEKRNVSRIIDLVSSRNPNFTADDIVWKYRQDQSDKYFLTFSERLITQKEEQNKMGMAKALRSTLRSMERFIGKREITFDDVDYGFVKEYKDYLIGTGVVPNTVSFYLRNFRTIYNLAYDSGVEMKDNNPFRKIHIRHGRTIKRALKKETIERISTLDVSYSGELEKARDLFMFSFYTRGMSFVDIVCLRHTDIVEGVIRYKRHKTNQYLQIAITKPLQKIIEKYRGDHTYVLPFINESNQPTIYKKYQATYGAYYRYLKELQEILDLTTPLTMHVARHSWATIAKEGGAPVSAISEGLGHASEKTTTIYLKEFDCSVIDKLNEKIVSFSRIIV